ncbi:rhombosortase [Microbulbifer magnicolonia]|uniref:rhombosortase n=1 Tax=Microbulbifer magnicolonia TaxID=3109744 RepID=UPI002B412797|nr:rhombosortase [Microbulbifer sp. GG15]
MNRFDFRGLGGPFLLFAGLLLCAVGAPLLEAHLVYERALVTQGEVWRLLTAHLTHTNLQHLLLLWILHGPHYRTRTFLAATAVTALATGACLHLFSPQTDVYLGLSGVLHGLIIWGGCLDIRARWRTGYLLVAGTWIKVGLEQWFGASADTAQMIGAEVAIDAHLWGAVAGTLWGLPTLIRSAGRAGGAGVAEPS